MEDPSSGEDEVAWIVFGRIGHADLFRRDRPAALEGDPEAWKFARIVIDHGGFILVTVNQVRADRAVRDSVTAALLRRALITAEGTWQLLAHSLEEPAMELIRTLLEIEINLKIVVQDPSDRMAKRLGAFHYLGAQRFGNKLLRHPDTRGKLGIGTNDLERTKQATKNQKNFFESDAFDEVREEMRGDRYWHGERTVEAAFEAAGSTTDYLQIYSLFSPFVHVTNSDADFAGIEDGKPALKALPQRDPRRTLSLLAGSTMILLRILDLYVEDREFAGYAKEMQVRDERSGVTETVAALHVLNLQAEPPRVCGRAQDVSAGRRVCDS